MSQFRGRVVLVVNVASKCGFTKGNYEQLAQLNERYKNRGLTILLIPSNQFGKQEPGDADTVCQFVQGYSKEFVIAEKADVNGANELPLYTWLKSNLHGLITNAIKWNFTKVSCIISFLFVFVVSD